MRSPVDPTPITLGLDLNTSAGRRRLTFAPGDDRVFTLGSARDADVRIEVAGVDPIHFSIERRGDELWLVPAKRGQQILVERRRVDLRAPLGAVAMIEFAEQRVIATVYEARDAVVSALELSPGQRQKEARRLPGPSDVTTPWRQAPRYSGAGFTERICAANVYRPPAPVPGAASEATVLDARAVALPSVVVRAEPTVISPAVPGRRTLEARLLGIARNLRPRASSARGQRGPLASLGRFAKRRPWLAAVLILASAGAVAVPLASFSKLRSAASPAQRAAAATRVPTPVRALNPTPDPPLLASRPKASPPAGPSLQVLGPVPPDPAPGSRTSPPLKRETDPAVADAVTSLVLGRDAQAKLAYEGLAARAPDNPAYRTLATLLERFGSTECADPVTARTCPQVKR